MTRKEGEWSDEDLKNEKIRCNLLQHFKSQVDLSRSWNGLKITDIISWLQSLKKQTTPTEEKIEGNMCKNEGKTNTVAKVDENKKIEEICDYIFKYEHYNSFYQYAVACAKAVAEWKNRETVNKAVEWLENNYLNYEQTYADVGGYISSDFNIDKMLIDFKQAMKEE